ncbi:MAG: hypothetical protein ACQER7_12130 [Bacteroidota bacterium]
MAAGDYDIKIEKSENNKCYRTYNLNVQQPKTALTIEKSKTDSSPATCKLDDGSLTFDISGGWTDKVYSVFLEEDGTQIDNLSISAGANDKTVTFENLPSGTDYQVTVTNDGSCETTLDNITVEETNPLGNLSISQTVKESCDGAENAELEIENADIIEDPFDVYLNNTKYENLDGHQIKGLAAQDDAYIKVKETDEDERGCVYDTTMDIKVLAESVDFSSSTVTSASCNTASDGSIEVEGEGGPDGGYKYKIDDQDYSENYISQSHSFDGLSSGEYTVSAKDAAGCEISEDITLDHGDNPVSVDTIIVDPALCANASDGDITIENISHSQGLDLTLSYSYEEGDENITSGEDFTYSNLGAKDYEFSISDANECSIDTTITLSHDDYQPDFSQSIEEAVACSGKENGRVAFELEEGETNVFEYELFEGQDLNGSPRDTGEVAMDTLFWIGDLTNETSMTRFVTKEHV